MSILLIKFNSRAHLLLELVTAQSSHGARRTREGESELLKHLSASSRKPLAMKVQKPQVFC